MRNAAGGLLVTPLSISSPEGAAGSDLVTVPNPVIHSCQILDPAPDVKRIAIVESEVLHPGTRMGYSRSKIIDAGNPARVIALTEGQGVRIGAPPEGLQKMDEARLDIADSPGLPRSGRLSAPRAGTTGTGSCPDSRWSFASPDAALHIGPQHVLLETTRPAGNVVSLCHRVPWGDFCK